MFKEVNKLLIYTKKLSEVGIKKKVSLKRIEFLMRILKTVGHFIFCMIIQKCGYLRDSSSFFIQLLLLFVVEKKDVSVRVSFNTHTYANLTTTLSNIQTYINNKYLL